MACSLYSEKEYDVKIGIIGPGALGCLFASRLFLAASEQDKILIIDHRSTRSDILNRQGILYESGECHQRLPIPVSTNPTDIGTLDVIFSCVKSYDLEKSLTFIAPLLSPASLLIFLQNGINHLTYAHTLLQGIPVFGTTSEGATRLGPGHIRHAGSGHTSLGFLSQQSDTAKEHLEAVRTLLKKGAITTTISNDIRSRIWAKLFINVGINGLTAIHDESNGQLLKSTETQDTLKGLVSEAIRVAISSGIPIDEDPVAATITVCKNTADNISSMLQDVRNHRPTEIDAINGAISRIGLGFGVATPLNDKITSQVKAMEKEYSEHSKS